MSESKHDFFEAQRSKNTGFCIGRFGVEAILHRLNGVPIAPGKAHLGQEITKSAHLVIRYLGALLAR